MENKRRFSRITFSTDCALTCNDQTVTVELIDISLKGALVAANPQFSSALNTSCNLTIKLQGLIEPLTFSGLIVHIHEHRLGIKFISTDIDSMIHLRGILENNSLEPERVTDELHFLIDAE